jgi:hypothetical protein
VLLKKKNVSENFKAMIKKTRPVRLLVTSSGILKVYVGGEKIYIYKRRGKGRWVVFKMFEGCYIGKRTNVATL